MSPSRIDFYDPLYDFVTFEEAARARPRSFLDPGFSHTGADAHGDSISPLAEAKTILPFLTTLEFCRQSFLRQNDLAFLVYPSATHTRFAHAIGSCYLGFIAAQRVGVAQLHQPSGDLTGSPAYLSEFLERTAWREEFYLALLLHDIGHFPFSHALESNEDFWIALGQYLRHEDAATQLILGAGPFWEASARRNETLSPQRRRLHPHLAELFDTAPAVDKNAVSFLISGKQTFLDGKVSHQLVELNVLHELVSGLLDLDRVDHYRRDSYFTGLRTGSGLNFASLLAGLTICYDPEAPTGRPELWLSPSAVGHAITLLQSKERLTEDCFEHLHNIAYEAMLHRAFNQFILGEDLYEADLPRMVPPERAREVYDLLSSTDEELLIRLASGKSAQVAETVFRIRNRAPYTVALCLSFPVGEAPTLQKIRQVVADETGLPRTDTVLLPSRGFHQRDPRSRTGEWLDLQRLRNAEGKRLVDGRYRRQIEHFKQGQEFSSDVLWVLATEDKDVQEYEARRKEICERLRCTDEALR